MFELGLSEVLLSQHIILRMCGSYREECEQSCQLRPNQSPNRFYWAIWLTHHVQCFERAKYIILYKPYTS